MRSQYDYDSYTNDPHYHDYVKQDVDYECEKEMEERTNSANGQTAESNP